MANLTKSYTLFGFTSPRTIEKIIPEIALLTDHFSGQVWSGNEDLQARFFQELFSSGHYEGGSLPDDLPFAARDRITRAPKALGFINLIPHIELTEIGRQLLSGKRIHETIARQLMKFQLPSPYHTIDKDGRFFVKPYLELLRLVYELNGLSKTEIAIYFLQLTNINKYSEIKQKIISFRTASSANQSNRHDFIEACFDKEVLGIYADQVNQHKFKTRESNNETLRNFLSTKKSNMRDYADAFIRYLRATQLVTFNSDSSRLTISEYKKDEVEFLLNTLNRKPSNFRNQAEFQKFLFSPDTLHLLADDRTLLTQHIDNLEARFGWHSPLDKNKLTLEQLKDYLSRLEENSKAQTLRLATKRLQSYTELPSILSVFEQIRKRELPDAALYLEWNVWRSLTMLNYAIQIKGNFTFDLDGAPLNTAAGNRPDIECEYANFKLIVEVTTSSGNTQFNMEGESVARHYGNIKRVSNKPVYCLFIAPKISEGALAHFFNLNRLNTKAYGGKTQIVPMDLATFIEFIQIGVKKSFSQTELLENLFKHSVILNQSAEDEAYWFAQTTRIAKQWI